MPLKSRDFWVLFVVMNERNRQIVKTKEGLWIYYIELSDEVALYFYLFFFMFVYGFSSGELFI